MTRGDAPSKTSHHTSGPWRASECLTVCQDGGGAIAQCFWVSGAIELEAAEANARLIAAAPELLAALQHARTCVPYPSDAHTKIVAAIAKATGTAR